MGQGACRESVGAACWCVQRVSGLAAAAEVPRDARSLSMIVWSRIGPYERRHAAVGSDRGVGVTPVPLVPCCSVCQMVSLVPSGCLVVAVWWLRPFCPPFCQIRADTKKGRSGPASAAEGCPVTPDTYKFVIRASSLRADALPVQNRRDCYCSTATSAAEPVPTRQPRWPTSMRS